MMFVSAISVSSSMLNDEMSVGTTILSFPWTLPSQELVNVVSPLHPWFEIVVDCSVALEVAVGSVPMDVVSVFSEDVVASVLVELLVEAVVG